MASTVPLYNAKVQGGSIDFNNQTPSNAAAIKRYTINNIGATDHTLSSADLHAVCLFSGNRNVLIPEIAESIPGTEVILYSSDGWIAVAGGYNVIIYSDAGNYIPTGQAGKLLKLNGNTWMITTKTIVNPV